MLWTEDLTKERMIEVVEPCSWDAYKRKFYWEKGNCDLHNPDEGTRR